MSNYTADVFALAACIGVDTNVFYPVAEPGSRAYDAQVARARAVCAGCPVQSECLALVLDIEDAARPWGVWAGTTPEQRTTLRRQRVTAARARESADAAAGDPAPVPAPAVRGPVRVRERPPSPGQSGALCLAHVTGGRVPATVSGSITQSLVRDGLAHRVQPTTGRRHTLLTDAGAELAAAIVADSGVDLDTLDALGGMLDELDAYGASVPA